MADITAFAFDGSCASAIVMSTGTSDIGRDTPVPAYPVRVMLMCGDQRPVTLTKELFAVTGIEAIPVGDDPNPTSLQLIRADALIIGYRQLRVMTRKRTVELTRLARRMPVIAALRAEETHSIAKIAHHIDGIVFPDLNLSRLAEIIRFARLGYLLLPYTIDSEQLQGWMRDPKYADDISAVEQDVLNALAEGLTNREISQRLGVSASKVKRLVYEALRKLCLDNRTQAAIYARRRRVQQ